MVSSPPTSSHISITSLSASSGGDVWAVGSQRGFGRRAPTRRSPPRTSPEGSAPVSTLIAVGDSSATGLGAVLSTNA
jgi:hypothetical protein